ncbi:MAG: molybdopterin converting factor [Gammaproteobacteria bacterium]|nr:MAG: molybdopterin converting factor [Gammaproteobacteria bacterium]
MAYHIALFAHEFQPFDYLQQQQSITSVTGAQSVFVGYMRDFRSDDSDKATITGMTISHYPGMTEKQLDKLAAQLHNDYHLLDLVIAHRVGEVKPTSPLVLVAATAVHRRNAIEAVSEALETLKHRAPFWKQEHLSNGQSRWVTANTQNHVQRS